VNLDQRLKKYCSSHLKMNNFKMEANHDLSLGATTESQVKSDGSGEENDQNNLICSTFFHYVVKEEMKNLQQMMKLREAQWKHECAIYGSQSDAYDKDSPSLYPYHPDFEILKQQEDEADQLERTGTLFPCRTTDLTVLFIPFTFVPRKDVVLDEWWTGMDLWSVYESDLVTDFEQGLVKIKCLSSSNTTWMNRTSEASDISEEKKKAMLNLIRHASSYLQRDFRLAAAVVMGIASMHLCDDVDYLRQLICVISTPIEDGYPSHCRNGNCAEEFMEEQAEPEDGWHFRAHGNVMIPNNTEDEDENEENINGEENPTPLHLNHSCHDVFSLYAKSMEIVISHGISFMSEEHALVFSAWALLELEVLCSLESEEAGFIHNPHAFTSKASQKHYMSGVQKVEGEEFRKALLKFHMNQKRELAPIEFKSLVLEQIVVGLGMHAAFDRIKFQHYVRTGAGNQTELRKLFLSWSNCVRALVSIGEALLRRLPPVLDLSDELTGFMMQGFLLAFVVQQTEDDQSTQEEEETSTEMNLKEQYERACKHKYSAICPTRYSNAIDHADELELQRRKFSECARGFSFAPPDDVQFVVRSLFIRHQVDKDYCGGVGYGTWLALCRLRTTPLDPLLFLLNANVDFEDDDSDSDEEDEESEVAYHDEVCFAITLAMIHGSMMMQYFLHRDFDWGVW